jgi:hypothetical protein
MIFIPGSSLSANDQLDNGPVMLRTATQISSKELKGIDFDGRPPQKKNLEHKLYFCTMLEKINIIHSP